MVRKTQVATSKAIQRQTGKTFYFATRLLPERVRHATYVLYAFFRLADEVVDDAEGVPSETQYEQLATLQAEALGDREPESEVLEAFCELRERYDIPDEDVRVFVDAMATDIEKSRYDTYDELETYMNGSAAAVGRMMTAVMQPEEPEKALPHATTLGEAFQMTNFLRDVREDIRDRDRIYLPGETLARHGVTEEQIREYRMDGAFADVMREELLRTERLYREGVRGIKYLPEDCQFPVLLASVLYAEHHRLIRGVEYDVLTNEPDLGTLRKVALLVRTKWHWRRSGDPEYVFRKVSAVPSPPEPTHGRHGEGLPTR